MKPRRIRVQVEGINKMVLENLLTKKDNGDYFKNYNLDMTPDVALNNAELLEAKIARGEVLVTGYIQVEVDKYNEANVTKFSDVHSCANYKDNVGYTHQQFCTDVWEFNVQVWEAGRLGMEQAITEDWDEVQLIESLPNYGETV